MRLRKPVLAQFLLLVSLLGAFGVGNYYPELYFSEIAGACTLFLFILLAFSIKMGKSGILAVFLPALGVLFFVLLYAYVFTLRTEAPLLPSILAQRDYVFFLLAPIAYMLHWRGWKVMEFGRLFIFASLLSLGVYSIVYATVDFESWLNSGNFYQQGLVVYDEVRGYRLKGPLFIFLFVALYFGRRALQAGAAFSLAVRLILAAWPVTLLIINAPRSTVLSVAIALILYGVFLQRARRITMSFILIPVIIYVATFITPYLSSTFTTTFGSDWSYVVRAESAENAWRYFLEYPFLGLGQASYQSISYQNIVGEQFHPSDIGLLGVAFQFGMVGVILYAAFGVWIVVNLLKLLWILAGNIDSKQRVFLWAFFVICLSFLVASPLQAPFLYGDGIPIGALSWGLLLAHKHGLSDNSSWRPHGYTRLATVVPRLTIDPPNKIES